MKNLIYKDLQPFKDQICTTTLFNTKESDPAGRNKIYKKQRKEYGFDARELWNLDTTTIEWMYCHLKRFKEWAPIELYDPTEAHIYKVKIIKKSKQGKPLYTKIENNNGCEKIKITKISKTLSIGKIIDHICNYFEYYIKDCTNPIYQEIGKIGMKLYAEILTSLWS